MGFLIFICIAAVIGLAVMFVGAPLRRAHEDATTGGGLTEGASLGAEENLETAREAKYREIRDAELDFRTGKLSEQDYSRIDGELRAEALEILDALERADLQRAQRTAAPEPAESPPELA